MKNRIIKFRVWHLPGKKFISNTGNPNIFPFDGKVGMTCNGNSTGRIDTDLWISENYILQQFTGLLDKNGKEIYDGDILKRESEKYLGTDLQKAVNKMTTETDVDKVVYSGSCFLAFKNPVHRLYNIEIIGNIYENPELIK